MKSRSSLNNFLVLTLLATLNLTLACDDEGLTQIKVEKKPDAGVVVIEEKPEPPVFPLKKGDLLELTIVLNGNEGCDSQTGSCDRSIAASYTITDTKINEEDKHWELDIDYGYGMTKAQVTFEQVSKLVGSKTAPFQALMAAEANEDGHAIFTTDVPYTRNLMTSNGFPFFHYDAAYANLEGSAFASASKAFMEEIFAIDPMAEISNQPASGRFLAYYVEEIAGTKYLHKILIQFHIFGFISTLDEGMVLWQDGMNRSQSSFSLQGNTTQNASLVGSIFVKRDGKKYRCTDHLQTCKDVSSPNCLDPRNPDAAPSVEACTPPALEQDAGQ